MKRSLLYLSFLGIFCWIIFSSSSGGRATSASSDNTISGCSCHNAGGVFSPSITMELLNSSTTTTGYIPGNSYTFSVTVSSSLGVPTGFGMQSKALTTGGVQAGNFTAAITPNSQISSIGTIQFAEQQQLSTTGVFQYTWVAPVSGTGDVVFYAAGNAVDGSFNTAGDNMTTPIAITITEFAPVCSAPTNLTVTNVTGTTADLGWITGGSTLWETEVIATGTTPTGVGNATANNPYTAMVAPGVTYDFYARDLCKSSLLITAAYDIQLTGGVPKGVELYAVEDIADMSAYALTKVTNGGGSTGIPTKYLPNVSLSAGSYYYVTNDSAGFRNYFGFDADFNWASLSMNGDDAIELYLDNTIIDVFGDVNTDGTGQAWEYLDGWAYRNSGTSNNMGTFDALNWSFSGPNAVDGCTANSTCASSLSVGTFTTTSDTSSWVGPVSFTTPCVTITPNEVVNNMSCNGVSDGNITIYPTGGGAANYTYIWSNGATTAAITGLSANNYIVTISYGGCLQTASYTIINPSPLSVSVSSTDVSCNGGTDGTGTAVPSGGTLPYGYVWSTGENTGSINAVGSAQVTITDASNCNVTASVTINQPAAITVTNTVITSVSCNGVCDGAATMTVNGGTTPYTYLWNNGQSQLAATGLCAGTVAMSITDANNCVVNLPVTITEPSIFSLSVSVTDATSTGASDGTASAVVTTTSNYTYVWNNTQTAQTATGYAAGNATVSVTEIGGNTCTQTATGVIADPASCNITVSLNATNITCNSSLNGSLSALATGGPSSLYTYNWSNGMSTASITGLNANAYAVTVNSGSCSATNTITLTAPNVITGTDAVTICSRDSVLIGGVYQSVTGTYLETQVSANGCDSVVSVSLTVMAGSDAGIGGNINICESNIGSTYNLFSGITGLSDSSGVWNHTVFGFPTELISTLEFSPGSFPFTYTLDDGNGTICSIDSSVVTVVVSAQPSAGGNVTTSACVSATSLNLATVLNNPTLGGTWLDISSSGALTDSIFDVTVVGVGNYTAAYAVAGNGSCAADTAFITVQIVSMPNAGVGNVIDACDTEFAIDPANGLSGSPDSGGNWNDDNNSGAYLFGQFSPTVAGVGDWNFSYTVSAVGCVDAVSVVTITVNASPNAGTDGTDTVCINTTNIELSTVIGGNPDLGGAWLDVNSSGALTGSLLNASALSAGIYNYAYVVSATSPCVNDTARVQITIDACVGIDEVNKVITAEIFPNPSTGVFTLQINNGSTANTSLSITSIDGRKLYSQNITSTKEVIDWKDAVAGIYFITITHNENKIIKQLVVE